MNIIKIQDDLKGAPDSALIGYVQNPTGQVPTYLALSELERRKSMREKYQKDQRFYSLTMFWQQVFIVSKDRKSVV
jgi:hypothetical protein